MARFNNTSKKIEGAFFIFQGKASRSKSVGIGIVVVSNESDMVGDMEAEESGEVAAEEESTTTTSPLGEEEEICTEMYTAGGEVATTA